MTPTLTFTCSICGEPSVSICVYCTKDACPNHVCDRCGRCSDCCECDIRLEEHHENGESEHVFVAALADLPVDGYSQPSAGTQPDPPAAGPANEAEPPPAIPPEPEPSAVEQQPEPASEPQAAAEQTPAPEPSPLSEPSEPHQP